MVREKFQILAVCTMNICRSPNMERLLTLEIDQVPDLPQGFVSVSSAGTDALQGQPTCRIVSEALNLDDVGKTSVRLTSEMVQRADLVVTADSGHISKVIALNPSSRGKIFTLRQVAAYAEWITREGALDVASAKASGLDVPPDMSDTKSLVEPLPVELEARLDWLVVELDAARGAVSPEGRSEEGTYEVADIPDPHELGQRFHSDAARLIDENSRSLGNSLQKILGWNL